MKLSTPQIPSGLFALAIFLLASFSLSAQTFIVGDFTGQNDFNTYPTPYGERFEGMRGQYLYRAADLIAAGVPAGNIASLGFFVVDVNGAGIHDNYTIKLAQTNLNTLTTWLPGATTVFGPVDYQPVAGLNTHNLTMPFFWNGTSNLVVEVCHVPTSTQGGNFSSESAIVQQTVGFAYQASLTYRDNNEDDVCTSTMISNTEETRRPRLWISVCQAPLNPVLVSRTSTGAVLSWMAPASGTPDGYEWVYGTPNFVPGGGGTQLGSGSGTGLTATLTNLTGNTAYSFYVRSKCGGSYSTYAGPVAFITEASCNDPFADTDSGPLGVYDTSENYVRTFCPDLAGNALTMTFSLFSTGSGDTLRIYNGDNTMAPLLGSFSGVFLPLANPGPFLATTSTGCLTVQFTSDTITSPLELGWLGDLTCAPLHPDSCYQVLQLDVNDITFTSAELTWTKMFGADSYTYKLFELPAILVDSAVTFNSVVNYTNLNAGTGYTFVVRSNCSNGENSLWDTIYFETPVRCDNLANGNSNLIVCGSQGQISASGTGVWNFTDCGPGSSTPGKEQVFRFIAPHTREYGFKLTEPASSNNFVNYFFKPISEGCGPTGWNCFGSFNNSSDSTSFGPLVAGEEYYILADPTTTATVNQRFKISGCGPLNDDALNAIELTLNSPCGDNVYSNKDATISAGEPDPDTMSADGYAGRWLESIENTVWFTFDAPASGTVTISTNEVFTNPLGDTQVALYEVGNPNDFSTFTLLESDEDQGSGFNSNFTYTGLEEGMTYYLQVDSWAINAEGPFCIEVTDDAVRQTNDACGTYAVANVSGTGWFNIYTSPEISDIGKIVLAINPLGQNLDTVFASIMTFASIPISASSTPYLPAYFRLRSSTAPTGPVAVRLFFYNSELEALIDTANMPGNTIDDLVVSQYNGPNTDCNQLNNVGSSTLVPGVEAVEMLNSFYLEFLTNVLGEFGAHFGPLALPLELESFTGKVTGAVNLLEWKTRSEKDVQWHIVERSIDGVHWLDIGRVAGKGNSNTTQSYQLTDAQPLASAYYRLRSVDVDASASLSPAIQLVRPDRQFAITGVLPNPASDYLTIRFHTPVEEQVMFRLLDVTGRPVLERTVDTQADLNVVTLPMAGLPAGLYQLVLSNGTQTAVPVRVVKQ